VGGLADTVMHASPANLAEGNATGIVMEKLDAPAITGAIDHALKLYTDIRTWKRLVQTAMAQDYSWSRSAEQYLALYTRALNPAG